MRGGPGKHRNRWWTRERMIEAGALFYRKHKCTPTNENWWHRETRFTANAADGHSNQGSKRPYPSAGSLDNFWKGMREFWNDVALAHPDLEILIDKGDCPWSALEEWFIVETAGVIPRAEVARLMGESGVGRTEPAIKRRLYELGVSCYNRWGWTINHLSRIINVSNPVIEKYMDHGTLPFFQGNKCLYIEPADFFVIQEYDWSKPNHPPELDEAVRKSLMQRLCFILLGFEWRKYSYHRIAPRVDRFTGRIKQPRTINLPPENKPNHIADGDWVRIVGEWGRMPGAKGRVGQVKNLVWSSQRKNATQKSPVRPPAWVATVEFRKMKAHGRPEYQRVRYNVPVDALARAENPHAEADAQRRSKNPEKRDRSERTARLRKAGSELAATHLNIAIEKKPVAVIRDQRTRERGQEFLHNRLTLASREIQPPISQRGRRDLQIGRPQN